MPLYAVRHHLLGQRPSTGEVTDGKAGGRGIVRGCLPPRDERVRVRRPEDPRVQLGGLLVRRAHLRRGGAPGDAVARGDGLRVRGVQQPPADFPTTPRRRSPAHNPLMTSNGSSRLSLWSTDSVLSIGSHGSVLSIGSVGSVASIASIGSAGSILSVGSALSTGSALSWRSRWSLLADQSFGAALASRGDARALIGPPAALAAVALAAYAGYLLARGRRDDAQRSAR
jgi:hypothetical protein